MSKKKPEPETFIVDCPNCKAKVAAIETGRAEQSGFWGDPDGGDREPFASLVQVGHCPKCKAILAGESEQIDFENYNAGYDRWSDVVRVYPKPPRVFTSNRIPKIVKDSLAQAEGCLQGNAPDAACVMLGRALEAICRHLLHQDKEGPKEKIMLGKGIKALRDKGLIDQRLFDWSQQLQAFRNSAAHPDEDFSASREDAEDLQSFVYAFTEYTYDLADRYEEFLDRVAFRKRKQQQKKK